MFNKDFFPTPKEVIEQMMTGTDIVNQVFLEPGAGKGNIVDYLQANGAKEVIACEVNDDLAKIVSAKCRLIEKDFLTVRSENISHVDCIVMNPPFSADEDHILHAWDIAPGGCTIISLCNDNTVNGCYRSTKKQEQIIEIVGLYGKKEYFGDCFSTAERKTDVRVSCIWLYKPKTGDDEFAGYFSLTDDEAERMEQGVMKYNYVREIVNRYVGAIKLFDKIEPLAKEMNDLTKPISEYGIKFGAFTTGHTSNYADNKITRDVYKKELQKQAWQKIFSELKMNKYVTKGVQEKINKFVETQIHVPFTMKNIYRMLEIIVGTHGSRMNQVLIEAFETICSFSWRENCTGGEKWKTNSDYVVNRRFIVPYICEYRDWCRNSEHVSLCYSGYGNSVDDIIKALCHITGMNYDNCSTLHDFVNRTGMEWGKWYEWGYFRIRGYKKGTMHFDFTDERVWEQFNRRVAKIKGWALPHTSNTTKKERKQKKQEFETILFS